MLEYCTLFDASYLTQGLALYESIDTHHRDLFVIGKKVLLLGPEKVIGLGKVFGGGDQDQVSLDLFRECKEFLLKITRFLSGVYFVIDVVLDQETDCKIKVYVDFFLKVLIGQRCFIEVDLRIQIFTQENGPLQLLLVL